MSVTPLLGHDFASADPVNFFHETTTRFERALRQAILYVSKLTRGMGEVARGLLDPRTVINDELSAVHVDFLSQPAAP